MIFEKVKKTLDGMDLGDFRNESDKVKLIQSVADQLTENNGVIVNRKLNTEADIQSMLLANAKNYLKARTVGRYIPRFPDNRGLSQDEIRMERESNFEYLKTYTERSGFVFRNPSEGQEALDRLAQSHHFEWNSERQPVARRVFKGMYAMPVPVDDVIQRELADFLDVEETSWRQMEAKAERRKKAIDLLGVNPPFTDKQREHIETMIERIKSRALRGDDVFSNKPVLKVHYPAYREAVKARELHNAGHETVTTMTTQERTRLDAKVANVLATELGLNDRSTGV